VWAGDVTLLLSIIVHLFPDSGRNSNQLVAVFTSGLVMLAILSFIFALFQHFAGLQNLRFVGSDSPAYGMARVALILLILTFVTPIVGLIFSILEPPSSVVRVFPSGDWFFMPLSGLLYFFYNVVLFGTLKRIGLRLGQIQIVKAATTGRNIFAAAIALSLFLLAIVLPAIQPIPGPSNSNNLATTLLILVTFIPSFIYYYLALSIIAQRASSVAEQSHGP
jgi:hypothetical protein